MSSRVPAWLLSVVLAAILAACGGSGGGSRALERFDGDRAFRDLAAQVAIGPRPSGTAGARAEVRLITSRLRGAGLRSVKRQRPWQNVVALIPGTRAGVIVLGAHYDTVDSIPGFVGANDGASGVAVLLELARSLPARVGGPSIQLVFFDGEEARGERAFEVDGTRGSRQYVAYAKRGGLQASAPLGQIRAMVLYDMVGDCDLRVPLDRLSSPELYAAFTRAAAQLDGSGSTAPFEGASAGVLDDHIAFRDAGVPALDLIDFDYGSGPSPGAWWHTTQDDLGHVCPASLDSIGEASLLALRTIGRSGG